LDSAHRAVPCGDDGHPLAAHPGPNRFGPALGIGQRLDIRRRFSGDIGVVINA
jgi:hypothetical protein